MISNRTPRIFTVLNVVIIFLLLLLPYYLFGSKLFLGGDDTRLLYAYPYNILTSLAVYSWNTISSLPSYLPNHHFLPLLMAESLLHWIIKSRQAVFNLSFSLPFILGFIYFRRLILKLLPGEYLIAFVSALIYVASPITIVSQMFNFLSPMWLVALMPILAFYYISYIENGLKSNVTKSVFWSILFSFALYSIPWLLSFILPTLVGILVVLFVFRIRVIEFVKKTILYLTAILCSQLFWVVPFVSSLTYKGENDLGGKLASTGLSDSFSPTVLATATGNIFYPLATFYHRSIAFNYDWKLLNTFLSYFDKTFILGIIYLVVVYLGIVNAQKNLQKRELFIFYFYFVSYIISLFLFTVNIGPLKSLFLMFRFIPGFTIFRNFTDKFSLGYIFIYSGFLATCLYVIKKSYKQYYLILLILIAVIIVNFAPVKNIVVTPFWKTNTIYPLVNLPEEYFTFTDDIKSILRSESNIFGFPQNIASYAVISETNGKNAYIGTSPLKFFTGVNDLSGSMSYADSISGEIRKSIMSRNYARLLDFLQKLNVGYVMVTTNIPGEVKNSYLFDRKFLAFQDDQMLNAIVDREIIRSKSGNYVLYKLKNTVSIFSSPENIEFNKISPVKYTLSLRNAQSIESLVFYETYHPGWKIYRADNKGLSGYFQEISDIRYIFKRPLFDKNHTPNAFYGNVWKISGSGLNNILIQDKNNQNAVKGGSIYLTLYFLPQVYFYFGLLLTVLTLGILFLLI